MNSSDTRVSAYLDDLARMLSDLAPEDRDEVLAGVREHLDATLAEHPDDPAAVDAALLRLGPPERVAAEARASLTGEQGPGARWDPGSRAWARVAVLATALGTAPFIAAQSLGHLVSGVFRGSSVLAHNASVALFQFAGGLSVGTPVWLVGLVGVAVSPHLVRRTRVRLLACGPLVVAAGLLVPMLLGVSWAAAPAAAAVLGVLALYVVVVSRRAWREVSR